MKKFKHYKDEAKAILKGKYKTIIGFLLLTLLIGAAIYFAYIVLTILMTILALNGPSILALIIILLTGLLTTVAITYLAFLSSYALFKIFNNPSEKYRLSDLISFISEKKIRVPFLKYSVLVFSVGILAVIFIEAPLEFALENGSVIAGLLLIGYYIGSIVVIYMIALTIFIIMKELDGNSGKDVKIIDALKLSIKMTKGYKFKMFLLGLSFIGWYILSIFTLGLLLLYVIPYATLAMFALYNDIYNTYLGIDDQDSSELIIQEVNNIEEQVQDVTEVEKQVQDVTEVEEQSEEIIEIKEI